MDRVRIYADDSADRAPDSCANRADRIPDSCACHSSSDGCAFNYCADCESGHKCAFVCADHSTPDYRATVSSSDWHADCEPDHECAHSAWRDVHSDIGSVYSADDASTDIMVANAISNHPNTDAPSNNIDSDHALPNK